jgi:hypothetical protein
MERFRFDERSSGSIEGDIVDRNGDPVAAGSLTAATLTLYDWDTGAGYQDGSPGSSPRPGILNGRDTQDVLNANDVSIDADGHFIWRVQPEDNVIVTARRQVERHRAMLLFAWSDGEFRFECELDVNNLRLQA